MIRFEKTEAPDGFEERVEKPGNRWLAANPGARRPRDLWSPFRPLLADAFQNLCAYSVMYVPEGTVDHFVSWNEAPSKAYEWSNLRYAAGWINSSKGSRPSTSMLDPFEVQDDWFELLLPSLQLVVTPALPEELRERAECMLEELHLRDDERVVRQRRSWLEAFENNQVTIHGLECLAPLLARALRKRDSL